MTTPADIHYRIIPKHPEAHIFEITCTVTNPAADGQRFNLPNWIPGSYMIRDFAKNIITISASSKGKTIPLHKLDKCTWQSASCDAELEISYQVYAWDLSVRTAHFDSTHGFFNGSSVFIRIEDQHEQPCSLTLLAPEGEQYKKWKVATSLPCNGADLYGFGEYKAANYEELIDHPVEMGEFSLASFESGGIPHDIVITGRHRADMPRLCRDLKTVCDTHIKLFSELPAMQRYVFLVMAVGDGYGGLEHRSSTSLLCSRNDLPLEGEDEISDAYRGFLGLCSHEYFHTWNIKQIKPAQFLPYDLSKETHTRQLWAFEGITSYYDDLGLIRSGLIDLESYLELIGRIITRVWRGKGRFKQSVADSSFDAWTKFYKQDESAPNNIVSYYTKGSLIALALDLTIRINTNYSRSLDDLMRKLWQEYGKPSTGLAETEIEQLASDICGKDLSVFFDRYLYNTEDPPLQQLLSDVGINFNLRAAENADDKGGTPPTHEQDKPLLGARVVADKTGALLSHVFDGGAAQHAGLSAGDVVVAVDKLKVTKNNLENLISSYPVGQTLTVHAFRRDELIELQLELLKPEQDTCYLTLDDKAGEQSTQNRNNWLNTHN